MGCNVISEIVEQGFCVGCGMCAALCPKNNLKIAWNGFGEYQPVLSGTCPAKCTICIDVCPRFSKNRNQYEIARDQFSEIPNINFDEIAGYYVKCFSGYASDSVLRNRAASGGLCTVFLQALFDAKIVDGIICVRPVKHQGQFFEFFVAYSYEQLCQAASSAYYPVEMSEIIRTILKQDERRYAIVGLPCFLSAISLAQERFPKIRRMIRYKIGLVCGSLPNRQFNEKILAQVNLSIEDVQSVKFRDTSHFPNRLRGIRITDMDGKEHFVFNAHEAKIRRSCRFIYTACMFCSDIFAETADVVFMDSWLPEYRDDHFGHTFVQIRNPDFIKISEEIKKQQLAKLNPIGIDKIICSQQPRIDNKRSALLCRINLCGKWGVPYPENIHMGMTGGKCGVTDNYEITLKFFEHLKSHGRSFRYRVVIGLLPHKLFYVLNCVKFDLKEMIRRYYFSNKYLYRSLKSGNGDKFRSSKHTDGIAAVQDTDQKVYVKGIMRRIRVRAGQSKGRHKKIKVIVNADDYGRDRLTTDNIIKCFFKQKITSATLMVVHDDSLRAAEIAKDQCFPVGLHLCLDEGHPISDPGKIPTLLDENGNLDVNTRKLYLGRIKTGELCMEIANQIERMNKAGLEMTHIDSHHHIHCHPFVFRALYLVCKTCSYSPFKIRSIRNFEYNGRLKNYGFAKSAYKHLIHLMQKKVFVTTDCFTSIVKYASEIILNVDEILEKVDQSAASMEIMCHPGKFGEYSHLNMMKPLRDIGLKSRTKFIDYSML